MTLLAQLGIAHPIIQAPLAGGGDTPALVAAVSEAGGLGFIGGAYLSPDAIREAAREVRRRTAKPFGINLFAPAPEPEAVDPSAALAAVAPYYRELGLPEPAAPGADVLRFDDQLAAALECGARVFSFTVGLLPAETIARIRGAGMVVMGTASTVEEARLLEAAGVDAVVLQGAEAGGHRCSFASGFEAGLIGTFALVPQAADALRIPVVASGGIMDGRGIVAALALGAEAVQMGTAFLTTAEAGIPAAYKDAIFAASAADTRVTRAFSGKPARGIANRFMREIDDQATTMANAILPFPRQNALTRPLRTAAAKAGRAEFLSLWAGQGLGLARRAAAGDLVARLVSEAEVAARRVAPPPEGMVRRIQRFVRAAAEGIGAGRACAPIGDVGTDGIRLAQGAAARLR